MGYQDELRKLPDVDPNAQHIARVVRDRIRTELSYLFDYPQYGQVTYRKSKNVFVFEFGGPGFHSDEADFELKRAKRAEALTELLGHRIEPVVEDCLSEDGFSWLHDSGLWKQRFVFQAC